MKVKKRLDQFLLETYPDTITSKSYAQSLIMQGKIRVNDVIITKNGYGITEKDVVKVVDSKKKYVSRAGYKLEHALKYFKIDVNNLICLDSGLSTGGFTDCLLKHGAQHVYGVDVGYGLVDYSLRVDSRVTVVERTNFRYLDNLPTQVDLISLDLSFISVIKVIPTIKKYLKKNGHLLILIKPQFEAERQDVGKKGIITDKKIHKKIVDTFIQSMESNSFKFHGVTESPILGQKGNKEFLAYFT